MSAFIVSEKQVNYVISAWASHKAKQHCYMYVDHDAQIDGQSIVNQNYDSVNYHYQENNKPYKYNFIQVETDVLQAIKFINHINYQCNETVNYNDSEVKELLDTMKNNLIYDLPGYNDLECSMYN